jgi:hypothetical protein
MYYLLNFQVANAEICVYTTQYYCTCSILCFVCCRFLTWDDFIQFEYKSGKEPILLSFSLLYFLTSLSLCIFSYRIINQGRNQSLILSPSHILSHLSIFTHLFLYEHKPGKKPIPHSFSLSYPFSPLYLYASFPI